MNTVLPRVRRTTGHTIGRAFAALALVASAGCSTDKILKVDRPDIIERLLEGDGTCFPYHPQPQSPSNTDCFRLKTNCFDRHYPDS